MNWPTREIAPALYLVATPLGNARDITLRALDLLASADVLAAEDTRSLRRLLEIHGVALGARRILAYHDHSKDAVVERLLSEVEAGKSVVYASEAGTPLISDPGFELVRAVVARGVPCTTAPGPVAAIAALTVSGLPSDRFLFVGFAPATGSKRRAMLTEIADARATLIFYESPKRLGAFLADAAQVFGEGRQAVVCRELTKKFEEHVPATLGALAERFADTPPRGEIVVVIGGATAEVASDEDVDAALEQAMLTLSVKDAAAEVSKKIGISKREAYQKALALGKR